MTKGEKHIQKLCYIEGYLIRRIFGYGIMDEVWAIQNGMIAAEAREREELGGRGR
jgi:hypothetical protein